MQKSLLLALLVAAGPVQAATLPSGFAETLVASSINRGTAMAFAPDGRLFVCQQSGELRVVKNGALLAQPFVTLAVDSTGERGLLGVAFDPNFASNNFVYVYYTVNTAPRHNRVSRFTANGDVALAGSETLILQLDNLTSATNHNGGAIHFGPDGRLYVAVGENATAANAQTLSNRLGKMLRINSDGSIPTDNPFFNTATGVNRSIWTLGLRNPFTFAFQPGTTRMFINDVGQSSFEEINDGIAGSNYGWPTTEGPTTDSRFRAPIFAYGRSPSSTGGCSITGGAFYDPPVQQFPASYLGKYFFADFCSGWIRLFDPANNTATGFATGVSNPVDLQVGPDGRLYYLARGNGGQVYAIRSTAAPSPTPAPAAQPLNISARLRVEPNENVLIAGFIISGGSKRVLMRGRGPSIGDLGSGRLADPEISLHGSNGSRMTQNADWQDSQREEIERSGLAPGDPREAAIIATLGPGPYTAIVSGKDASSGIALAEVYDLDNGASSRLANLSARGFVRQEGNVLIGGVILAGNSGTAQVIFRALGPSLTERGLANVLSDPTLDLRNSSGERVLVNDNWQDDPAQAEQISRAGLAPRSGLESAIFATLPPGAYTAIVAGRNGGVGLGLIEVYSLTNP